MPSRFEAAVPNLGKDTTNMYTYVYCPSLMFDLKKRVDSNKGLKLCDRVKHHKMVG